MTKIKKLFLTLASALCCVLCLTLAILGITSKKNVHAESVTYETATVYDVSQLSSSGPAAVTGDASWFDGKTKTKGADVFAFNNAGYAASSETVDSATTYTAKSVGVTFQMKTDVAFPSNKARSIRLFICNTEISWLYDTTNGYYLQIWDAAESGTPMHEQRVNPNDTDNYIDGFDPTVYTTYTIVKSLVDGDATSYKVDVYMNGTHEYTAIFTAVTPKVTNSSWAVDQLRIRNNDNMSVSVKSAFADETEAKDIYDYNADENYLSGKTFESKAGTNADVIDKTGFKDVSADSFGLTFKVKFDTEVVANKEVIRARIGTTYDVRLSVVTAGASGKAQINIYDWTGVSTQNKVMGSTDSQFDVDFTKEHTYTFIKEKISDTTSGYVYSAYVDGNLIQRVVYNVAPTTGFGGSNDYSATNRMRIIIQNGAYTGTFSSAKYYGVKVDGVMNKVNVGESFTLPEANVESGEVFLGYDNGSALVKAGAKVSEYGEYTTQKLAIANDEKATIRLLHTDESSLKWTTKMDTASYNALIEKFGAENVSFAYEISTTEAEGTINKEITEWATSDDGSEMSVGVILSHIKENHYTWDFTVTIRFSIAYGEATYDFEVADNNNAVSIAEIAEEVYNEADTPDALKALLSKYFAA